MHQAVAAIAVADKAETSPEDKLRIFRELVRSLAADAAIALGELEMWCEDADQLERCQLVRHYLDYMQRLCDGTA